MTGAEHVQFMKLRHDLVITIRGLQQDRWKRPGTVNVDTPHGVRIKPAFVPHEQQGMTNAVNQARTARGLPPVTLEDVQRVEQQAVGHIDYTAKFALYCAELAWGRNAHEVQP